MANKTSNMTWVVSKHDESCIYIVMWLSQVLRPFLLRRLKKDVEKQMPKKYEHVIMCRLSKRQRFLYDDFMSQTKWVVLMFLNFTALIKSSLVITHKIVVIVSCHYCAMCIYIIFGETFAKLTYRCVYAMCWLEIQVLIGTAVCVGHVCMLSSD